LALTFDPTCHINAAAWSRKASVLGAALFFKLVQSYVPFHTNVGIVEGSIVKIGRFIWRGTF
jgi:hypothetical protein